MDFTSDNSCLTIQFCGSVSQFLPCEEEKRHRAIEKPYSFELCGYTFVKMLELQLCTRTGTGETPHSSAFLVSNNNARTKEKTYSFEICTSAFFGILTLK